jgi:integrase
VKPFEKVKVARIRYLTDDEATRLVNVCETDLRALVTAALLTGCRYQELATARPADVNLSADILSIRESKSGNPRTVVLTAEGVDFFRQAMAGKASTALLFPRTDGSAWGKSHQFRPLKMACNAGKIAPAISFHNLRHTHASRLVTRGVPLQVVAAQLGHADTRITERYYAHLAPSYAADTIRAAFGNLGLVQPTNVATLQVAANG